MRREKSSRSQTAKLLKAIQDRLPGKVAGAGTLLKVTATGLGGTGEHDLIRAAPKVRGQDVEGAPALLDCG